MAAEIAYCVVNTNAREHLLACLAAIERAHPSELEPELLILDNASEDGSAQAASEWAADAGRLGEGTRTIERQRRTGKAENDSLLLREASAPFCLLLNEDTELLPGSVEALLGSLRADSRAGAAGARLLDPNGRPQPCAWRLPGVGTALLGAVFAHKLVTVQSRGSETRPVGWAQSAAMLVRREAAEEINFLDPDFFVYSDETDFCKRLGDAGWRTLYVPSATAIHHEQLAHDRRAGARRVVEFHRNRDRYMRKHHSRASAALVRLLTAWSYLPRALAALVLPKHDPSWYLLHSRQALLPSRGEGLREAAEVHNWHGSTRA